MWRVAEKVSNKQSRIADKGWSSSFGIGLGDKRTALNHTKIIVLSIVTQNLIIVHAVFGLSLMSELLESLVT
jgi:hypothetical protein